MNVQAYREGEQKTHGVKNRLRARVIWQLKAAEPSCTFCSNRAIHHHSDHLSPIYLLCEGCSDAFAHGLALGAKGVSGIWGDLRTLDEFRDFYKERLGKWEKLSLELFSTKTKVKTC